MLYKTNYAEARGKAAFVQWLWPSLTCHTSLTNELSSWHFACTALYVFDAGLAMWPVKKAAENSTRLSWKLEICPVFHAPSCHYPAAGISGALRGELSDIWWEEGLKFSGFFWRFMTCLHEKISTPQKQQPKENFCPHLSLLAELCFMNETQISQYYMFLQYYNGPL